MQRELLCPGKLGPEALREVSNLRQNKICRNPTTKPWAQGPKEKKKTKKPPPVPPPKKRKARPGKYGSISVAQERFRPSQNRNTPDNGDNMPARFSPICTAGRIRYGKELQEKKSFKIFFFSQFFKQFFQKKRNRSCPQTFDGRVFLFCVIRKLSQTKQ